MKDGWTKKTRGSAVIHTHPGAFEGRAVVVTIYGIFFNGVEHPTLEVAKASALSSTHQPGGDK